MTPKLQLGSGDFTAATLTNQATSEWAAQNGLPDNLLNLILAYTQILERELILALVDIYVETGIGGINPDTFIDRRFVEIRQEAKTIAGP